MSSSWVVYPNPKLFLRVYLFFHIWISSSLVLITFSRVPIYFLQISSSFLYLMASINSGSRVSSLKPNLVFACFFNSCFNWSISCNNISFYFFNFCWLRYCPSCLPSNSWIVFLNLMISCSFYVMFSKWSGFLISTLSGLFMICRSLTFSAFNYLICRSFSYS